MIKICFLTIILFLVACSTQPVINIRSLPEGAEVSVKSNDGSMKSIGKTPLSTSPSNLGSGRFSNLIISKQGHREQNLIFGKDTDKESYDIFVTLNPETENPKLMDAQARHEKLAKLLLKAHSLTNQKKYSEAESVLATVTVEFPHVSAGYDLLGNIAYLQRDLKKALIQYQKSIEINPENLETRQLVNRLKSMVQ